jgi:predicted phosphodiesterase
MRIAILADIHGNSAALDAVLADIDRKGIIHILNLGDCLSGPLDPAGTADRLIARPFPTIAGNHDRWLIDRPAADQPLWEQWSLPLLSPVHLDWIRTLPPTRVEHGVLMTHGTARSDTENWLHQRDPQGGMRDALLSECAEPATGLDHPVILSGHTHRARAVRLPDGRLLVNPGSVGCPAYLDTRHDPPFIAEAGTPDACYAVLEQSGGHWQASLCQVPYDPVEMIDRARALGANDWAEALKTGWMRGA